MDFVPVLELYIFYRVLEGLWEFAHPAQMCFVDLEKVTVSFVDFCGRCSSNMVSGVCTIEAGAWFALLAVSDSRACWTQAGLPFVISPVLNFYEQDF